MQAKETETEDFKKHETDEIIDKSGKLGVWGHHLQKAWGNDQHLEDFI